MLRSVAVFLAYAGISFALFGRALLGNFERCHLGLGNDPSFLMWALAWWPHAIRHGLNPFICRLVWAPDGFNLAWSGGIPLLSIGFSPLTAAIGPIATYNVLCLIAPALAAWSAFILCRSIARSWAAFIAGYLFGFSPYMLGQLIGGHLNLMLAFPAPLIAWNTLLAIHHRISRVSFVTLLTALFVVQFLCSIELAASVAIFGAIALLLGWYLGDNIDRLRVRSVLAPIVWSAGASLLVLSPYLFYLFQPNGPRTAINSPGAFSADLANLIIPTRTIEFGLLNAFQLTASRFPGNTGERDAYLGLPLLLVIFHYGWTRWRERAARLLLAILVIVLIFALGPRLRFAGFTGFGMPWKLAMHLPMLKSALPARFMNYAFLIAAIIISRWLVDNRISFAIRAAFALLIVASMVPNLNAVSWITSAEVPELFTQQDRAAYVHSNEIALAIPYGIRGDSMLWQAVSGMDFRMAGGYTGMTPRSFEQWPIVNALMTSTYIPDATDQLLALMAAKGVAVVIINDAHQRFWKPLLTPIDLAPKHISGVWLYRPAPDQLARYSEAVPVQFEQRNAVARFDALLAAANAYFKAGGNLATLTPMRAQQLGLLPPHWVTDPDVRTNNGLYLGPWNHGQVAVGVVGSYPAFQPLIEQYKNKASAIFFPFPKELGSAPSGDTFMRLLVMTFDADRLSK
jgi:hypothetical protein